MKMKWAKYIASMALVAVMVGATAGSTALAEDTPVERANPPVSASEGKTTAAGVKDTKEEVVYANLAPGGDVNHVYVVNQFEVDKGGELTDYGRYSSVENLTSTAALTRQGDKVTAPVEPGNFSYQGNLETKDLPWTFDITYKLNGALVDAGKVAGASGELEIGLATRQNMKVDPTFYDNYLLQISLNLDAEKCSNIASRDATIANAGRNKVVTHTVMPGKDGDITITAKVENFSMTGFEIAAMPYSMAFEMPDTDGMVDEMTTLTDAISALNDGVGVLAGGVAELSSGVSGLVDGSATFAGGLNTLSANSGALTEGSAGINTALDTLSASLSGGLGGDMGLGDLAGLPEGLRQLSGGLRQVSGGMTQLKAGYDAMYGTLNAAIMGIPDGTLSEGELQALAGLIATEDPTQMATYQKLVEAYAAAQTVKGTYTYPDSATGMSIQQGMGAVSGSLDAMATSLNTMASGIDEMAAGIENAMSGDDTMAQLKQLADGMAALAQNYGNFHAGLVEYTGGVNQMADGYGALHGGLEALSGGTAELASGTRELHNGTGQLDEAVSELPDTIELEIDKLTEDYLPADFTPVSFSSQQNASVSLVQFVFMTEGITAPEPAEEAPLEEEDNASIWDRFLALFTS